MIKLIALDIDGTLLSKRRKVSKENITAINAARDLGVKIAIATGRNHTSIYKIAKAINIPENDEFIIGLNGGVLFKYDSEKKPIYIFEKYFNQEESEFVFKTANDLKVKVFAYNVDDEKYSFVNSKRGPTMWWMKNHIKRKLKLYKPGIEIKGIYKTIVFGKGKRMVEFRKIMDSKGFSTFGWSYVIESRMNVEVNPKGVDKVIGLKELAKHYKIKPENVMYFGDGENDLKSLEWAGFGVAMANAADHVKEKANLHTAHHLENGVAKKIFEAIESGDIK